MEVSLFPLNNRQIVVRLLVFAFGFLVCAGELSAKERFQVIPVSPPDAIQALKEMEGKKAQEERELKRLSAMSYIPGGEFVMGSEHGDSNESPEHTVYLDSFYIDRYEVTQLQYLVLMGENPSYFKGCPLCPVEKVSYYQATTYCSRLSKRLPTEAEWEKAARAGSKDAFYWGNDVPDDYSWYGNNSNQKTHPVGLKGPNAFDLYDMAGNVWEWVNDRYNALYYKNSPLKNPKGPDVGSKRTVRGGSWGDPPSRLRSSYRDKYDPDTNPINGGFRCVSSTKPD